MMTSEIEQVARAIARLVPIDGCSRWHPEHGHDFPREYSAAEQRIIRGIAQTALETIRQQATP